MKIANHNKTINIIALIAILSGFCFAYSRTASHDFLPCEYVNPHFGRQPLVTDILKRYKNLNIVAQSTENGGYLLIDLRGIRS